MTPPGARWRTAFSNSRTWPSWVGMARTEFSGATTSEKLPSTVTLE
jgi:hypothetical protein